MPKYEVRFDIGFEVEAENEEEALDIGYSLHRSEAFEDIFSDITKVSE